MVAEDDVTWRQVAKMPRELNMLGMIKMLISKENDLPFQKCLADTVDCFRRKRLSKINIFYFRPNVYRHRSNINF